MGCSQKKITTSTCQSIADKIESINIINKTNLLGTVVVLGGGLAVNMRNEQENLNFAHIIF